MATQLRTKWLVSPIEFSGGTRRASAAKRRGRAARRVPSRRRLGTRPLKGPMDSKIANNSDWVGSKAESVHCLRNRSRSFAMLAADDIGLMWDWRRCTTEHHDQTVGRFRAKETLSLTCERRAQIASLSGLKVSYYAVNARAQQPRCGT